MPFVRTSAGTWQFQSSTDTVAAGTNDSSVVARTSQLPAPSYQAVRRALSALYRIEDFTLQPIGSGFFAQIYKVMFSVCFEVVHWYECYRMPIYASDIYVSYVCWQYQHYISKMIGNILHKFALWEVEGIRQRGHPRKTWWDYVKDDVESLGLSQNDVQYI